MKRKIKCTKCGEELTYELIEGDEKGSFRALDFIVRHLVICQKLFEIA